MLYIAYIRIDRNALQQKGKNNMIIIGVIFYVVIWGCMTCNFFDINKEKVSKTVEKYCEGHDEKKSESTIFIEIVLYVLIGVIVLGAIGANI